MEEHCSLESFRVKENGAASCSDRPSSHVSNDGEGENVEGFLADLESYMQDINDRLTISRMVSDSVIKGMVSAVEQEAVEKIGEKQLEVARLEETLCECRAMEERDKLLHIPLSLLKEGSVQQDSFLVISKPHKDHGGNLDFLRSCIKQVKEQLAKLKKEVSNIKGGNRCRRINSGDELVGLGGILLEEESERFIGVDSMFDGVQSTLDSFFGQLKDTVHISKTSLREMQQEWELRTEIEAIVITNYVRSLRSEFERKLWDLNCYSYGCENLSFPKKIKEITALREELFVLSNLLCGNDNGQLVSQLSLEDGEECLINRRTDHLNRKLSGNHLSSASPWEGSGKHDELIITRPENLDPAQLKHMGRDELINYFKSEMTKMKRYHESKVQEMTEEVFSLKREYLKERGSSLTVRKDKEIEGLKRKIHELVIRLDEILKESNSIPQLNGDAGSLGTMRERLEDLLAENHRLRSILSDKKKEVKCLLSQISNDAKQISSHSSAETKLLEMIRNLIGKQEDAQVDASVSEEVYKCIINEMMAHMQHISGNLGNSSCQSEFENLYMESAILQGLDGMIFAEVLKDAKEKLCHLSNSYINEMKLRISLEQEAMEKQRSLELKISENEKLKQKTTWLAVLVEEKDKLALETASELFTQMKQCEIISQELDHLKAETTKQQIMIAEMYKESELMKGNLAQGHEQIKTYARELNNLNEKLRLAAEELTKANEERGLFLAANQDKENALQLLKVEEKENLEQLKFMITTVHELLKKVDDLEQSISEDIQRKNMRLRTVSSQLSSLRQKAVAFRSAGSIKQQRLEKRCSDLQKAEAEVDLLGDQVDTLLNLLEKIYIGLDHYSPILQHYPGIMEVLKLVRRELTGESLKLI